MMNRKMVYGFLFAAAVAWAAPPGLQGPFVPIEVVQVNAGADSTTAVVDYYARTDDYADLYQREQDTFSKSEMVGFASDLIGTPWEGATCAALLDAGYEEPCAIPPNLPTEPADPVYGETGYCDETYATNNDFTGTMGNCFASFEAGYEAYHSTRTFLDYTVVCQGNQYRYWGHSYEDGVIGSASNPQNNMIGYWMPSDPALACSTIGPPPPLPPEPVPPTDDELYQVIRPAISTQYFYDYSTQRISNNSVFSNTATNITNIYNTYVSTWTSGSPIAPSGYSPVPIPAPPATPSQTPTSDPTEPTEPTPGQCEEFPNSFGCADASGLTGEDDVPTFTPTTLAVGDTFSPVVLSTASACPAPLSIPFLGDTVEISYEIICDLGPTVSPLFLLIAAFSGLFIIIKGSNA